MMLRLFAATLLVFGACAAHAQPANDNFANAEVIAALPFADTEAGIGNATVESGDPIVLCRVGGASAGGNTVWYRYTTGPVVEYVTLTTATSNYDTMLSVYTGMSPALQLVSGGCSDDGVLPAAVQSTIAGLRLQPSTTYHIAVARFTPNAAVVTLNLSVQAALQYAVTETADSNDGLCDAHCSLREAITTSNGAPGAILLPAGIYGITLAGDDNLNASGDFDVRAHAAIYGAGMGSTTITGNNADRVFHVDAGATNRVTAHFADVTIRNGSTGGEGAGVLIAGGNNFVAFDHVALIDHIAGSNGGAVRGSCRMQFRDSRIADNFANAAGGGLFLTGGIDTTVEISRSTIASNVANGSSGIGGGGIHSIGRLRVYNSTISGNWANLGGGGIDTLGTGSVDIRSSTIAGNIADLDDNDSGTGGGLRLGGSSAIVLANNIIADNIDNNAVSAPDCARTGSGGITTRYNLVEQSAGGCMFSGVGDLTGVDPQLGDLVDNGGPTPTHALTTGAAVDSGDAGGCTDYLDRALTTDQRGTGFSRAANGICDRGAFELQVPATVPGVPDLVAASDSGNSDADDITNNNTPTFTGSCASGDAIDLLEDGTPITPSVFCAGGIYSITLVIPLADGPHDIRARATLGTTVISNDTLGVVIDTVANAPAITGPAVGGTHPIFVGNAAEPGATVLVSTAAAALCDVFAGPTGAWACLSKLPLPPGATSVFARQRDVAGNESTPSNPFTYTLTDTLFGNSFE